MPYNHEILFEIIQDKILENLFKDLNANGTIL